MAKYNFVADTVSYFPLTQRDFRFFHIYLALPPSLATLGSETSAHVMPVGLFPKLIGQQQALVDVRGLPAFGAP